MNADCKPKINAASQQDEQYSLELHPLGMRPGLDPDKINQLLDDIEVEEALEKLKANP